jgi:hypothetical protein
MRLGLLGPAGGDIGALGRAAEFLLNNARVHRAIYLGNDGALDRAVAAWARKLVGADPSDESTWARAAELALGGSPEEIDRFVASERARLRLKALEALPGNGARTIEMIGDRLTILIHDRKNLDEEDVLGANLVVFGESDGPKIQRSGPRWFVTPGPIVARGPCGLAVLDDEHEDDVLVTIYDPAGQSVLRETLGAQRAQARAGEP